MIGILTTKNYETFVVRFEDGSTHAFEGAKKAGRALPGDTVVVSGRGDITLAKRATYPQLVGTLELHSKTRYGMTSRGVPIYLFKPWREDFPPFYVGCSHRDTTRPALAIVRFESWDVGSACPRGSLARPLLGMAGDLETEEAALQLHHVPWKAATCESIVYPELSKEIGRRHLPEAAYTVSIDPPDCRDIDDAISVWEQSPGVWNVAITIADVAVFAERNPWIVSCAQERGQTIYKGGQAIVPMLPRELSEDLCSLREGVGRYGITLFVQYDRATKSRSFYFQRSFVVVNRNHTYESVLEDPRVPAELLSEFFGSTDTHEWVEQAMLFYNREFARALVERGCGILRRHAAADAERMAAVADICLHLAYAAATYCSVGDADTRHWGLSEAVYCHASSPIRRFADLYNQLCWVGATAATAPIPALNAVAKSAKAFERDIRFVRAILPGPTTTVEAVPLPTVGVSKKQEFWIPSWGLTVKLPLQLEAGQKTMLRLFADPTRRSWKRRMVAEVVDSANL